MNVGLRRNALLAPARIPGTPGRARAPAGAAPAPDGAGRRRGAEEGAEEEGRRGAARGGAGRSRGSWERPRTGGGGGGGGRPRRGRIATLGPLHAAAQFTTVNSGPLRAPAMVMPLVDEADPKCYVCHRRFGTLAELREHQRGDHSGERQDPSPPPPQRGPAPGDVSMF